MTARARRRTPWTAAPGLCHRGTALTVVLVVAGACQTQPDILELSPAGFTEHLGQLAAPINLPAGAVVRGVVVDLRCLDIETRVIACVRATDPLDPAIAEAWCARTDACMDAVDTLVIAMPDVTVGPRRTLEVLVASPALASVQVRGAEVMLGTARARTSTHTLGGVPTAADPSAADGLM